jgi:mannose/fructose-specific phosphotransferase system component IIA
MRQLLIATHGSMAGGIKESLGILVGNTENITVINCFTEEINPKQVIADYFENLSCDDELIVMTDIMGGSVNQMFMAYLDSRAFHLISGINLSLVLQIALCFDDTVTPEFIEEIIEISKSEIKYVNKEVANFAEPVRGDDDLF